MSSASRTSFYAEPGKGMRALLAALVERADRTDFTDPVEVAGLRGTMRAAFDLIEARMDLEERVLGPLLRAHAPASALEIASAHASHRTRMRVLLGRLAEAEWRRDGAPHALVVAIARFAADVTAHVADQEEIAMPALLRALSSDAIAETARALERDASVETRLGWLRWSLPRMTHAERVARLRAMRSDPLFSDAVAIARTVLDDEDRARLDVALALPSSARAA